ncbi:hypothetical protein GLOIN_2v1773797 [Rhizophagus irregularis DAOM 181602=DAOM 197198]|nr:hypothetical protein GLOIN_2v1773797 [Rhizophagus irregularis DAOM 181602=DAOM 197198]
MHISNQDNNFIPREWYEKLWKDFQNLERNYDSLNIRFKFALHKSKQTEKSNRRILWVRHSHSSYFHRALDKNSPSFILPSSFPFSFPFPSPSPFPTKPRIIAKMSHEKKGNISLTIVITGIRKFVYKRKKNEQAYFRVFKHRRPVPTLKNRIIEPTEAVLWLWNSGFGIGRLFLVGFHALLIAEMIRSHVFGFWDSALNLDEIKIYLINRIKPPKNLTYYSMFFKVFIIKK